MIKHIPNTITCFNLLSGTVGIVYALEGNYTVALCAVLLSAVFDFLDGLAARALKAYSAMGKELDSLADVVSFGVVPAAMLYHALSQSADLPFEYFPFLAFILTAFSALRLAKFNVDERQSTSFFGLAVPANAIFWVGAVYGYGELVQQNIYIVLGLMILFSYLLISEIPMFSLKMKNLSWKDNYVIYIFLIGAIILASLYFLYSLPFIILWYILWSIVNR